MPNSNDIEIDNNFDAKSDGDTSPVVSNDHMPIEDDSSSDDSVDEVNLYIEGEQDFKSENYDAAKTKLEKSNERLEKINKWWPPTYTMLAKIYFYGLGNTEKDLEKAREYQEYLDEHLSNDKKNIEFHKLSIEICLEKIKKITANYNASTRHLGKLTEDAFGLHYPRRMTADQEESYLRILKEVIKLYEETGKNYYKSSDYKKAFEFLNILLIKLDSHYRARLVIAYRDRDYYLAKLYYHGYASAKDYKMAIRSLSKVYLKNVIKAKLLKARIFSEGGYGINANPSKALKIYQGLVKKPQDCPKALFDLEKLYLSGKAGAHIEKSALDTIKYFNLLLEQSPKQKYETEAHYHLAKIYKIGRGEVAKDLAKAEHHLKESAKNDYLPAIEMLADLYKELNNFELENKYRKYAEEIRFQANAYEYGINCIKEKKYVAAKSAFEQTIETDEINAKKAHLELGHIYSKGLGVDKNNQQAIGHYTSAAESSELYLAHYYLGICLSLDGETQDLEAAKTSLARFFRYAPNNEGKIKRADYHLANIFEKQKKLEQAIKHYELAAANDFYQAYDKLWDMVDNLTETDPLYLPLNSIINKLTENIIVPSINPVFEESRYKEKLSQKSNLEHCLEIAELGNVSAQFKYGNYLLKMAQDFLAKQPKRNRRLAVQQREYLENFELAKQWLEKSAAQNNPDALNKLGEIAHEALDFDAAITYFKKSIELDNNKAKDNLARVANELITSLLYNGMRDHGWKKPQSIRLRQLLNIIDEKFATYSRETFEETITKEERDKRTYFGIDLSDNSDSEEEDSFQKCSPSVRQAALLHSRGIFTKANQAEAKKKLTDIAFNNNAYSTNSPILTPNHKIGKTAATTDQIIRDLKEINYWRQQGDLVTGLERSSTKFVIAQYRGITYTTNRWNKPDRIQHRKKNETGLPLYSSSVLESAGVKYISELTENDKQLLEVKAQELKDILISLRGTGHYKGRFNHEKVPVDYEYDSVAHYMQNLYTKDYDRFQETLKNQHADRMDGKPVGPPDFHLPNASMPFVSTGDTPLHALKYAYGIKPYQGHHHERLQPRWRNDGTAERPYSGKVYLSLHPITDYDPQQGAMHIVSLNHLAKIRIDSVIGEMIINEYETTFPSSIPANRVVYTHIAKYPSFASAYKEIYAIKYGLDQELYDSFRAAIKEFRPHSEGLERVKILLGEYLCHYHQVRLFEQAIYEAEIRGQHVVYLNEFGDLSVVLAALPPKQGKERQNLNDLRKRRHNEVESDKSDNENNEHVDKAPRVAHPN